MVWTQQGMIESYGNAMPESYYEQGAKEWDEFLRNVEDAEWRWGAEIPDRAVLIKVLEVGAPGNAVVELHLDALRIVFPSLYELESYLERMYP